MSERSFMLGGQMSPSGARATRVFHRQPGAGGTDAAPADGGLPPTVASLETPPSASVAFEHGSESFSVAPPRGSDELSRAIRTVIHRVYRGAPRAVVGGSQTTERAYGCPARRHHPSADELESVAGRNRGEHIRHGPKPWRRADRGLARRCPDGRAKGVRQMGRS